MSRPERLSLQQGFSLLELLVAFSIMALSLGMLYQASGSSVRNLGDIEQQQRAAVLGESILAMRDWVYEGGWNEEGESAGYRWQVRSAPFPTEVNAPNAVPLHEVRITISWTGRDRLQAKQLDLVTLLPQRRQPPA